MRLFFTPLAEQDLESIGDYIAVDNPGRALTFLQELRRQCQRIMPAKAGAVLGADNKTQRSDSLARRCVAQLLAFHAQAQRPPCGTRMMP